MSRLIGWLLYRIFGKRIGRIIIGVCGLGTGLLVLFESIATNSLSSGSGLTILLCLGGGALLLIVGMRTAPKNPKQMEYSITNQVPGAPYGQQPYPYPQQAVAPGYPPQPYGQPQQPAAPGYPPQVAYPQQPVAPGYPPQPYGQPQYPPAQGNPYQPYPPQ